MNTHDDTQQPRICERFASILPLLDDSESDATETAAAREHLRQCPRCRALQAQYTALEAGLRARYGVASVARHPTEDIMRHISERTEEISSASAIHHTPASRHTALGSFLRGLGAVACIAALIAVSFALFSSRVHVGSSGKTYTGLPTYTFAGTSGSIASVSMISPTEGWALAQTIKTPQGTRSTKEVTFYHFLNGTWAPVYVPISVDLSSSGPNGNGGPGGFNGTISMDSPTDGWADVHNFNRVTVLLHYTGGAWHEVHVSGVDVIGVQALSPHSVWAMGWDLRPIPCSPPLPSSMQCTTPGETVLHYDGTRWIPQSLPISPSTGASVIDYAMSSDSHGWALASIGSDGSATGQRYAILRYDGSAWTILSTYSPGDQTNLTGFSMASDTDGWVLGERSVADASGSTAHVPLKEMLYHYVDGQWSAVSLPIHGGTFTTLERVMMLSATDGWILGVEESAYPGATVADYQAHTVLFHYAGGAWTQAPTPDANAPVATVAQLSFTADGSGWAGGFSANVPASQTVQTDDIPASASPMLWSYHNGRWSVYQQ